jgi:hypothetical protein
LRISSSVTARLLPNSPCRKSLPPPWLAEQFAHLRVLCFDDNRAARPAWRVAFEAGFDPLPDEGERHMESSHIVALQTKHDGLERRIREEMNRPIPDDTILQTLKKQKLQIKQEIVAL